MFANHPEMAKRWAKHTKDIKSLPEKKKEKRAYEFVANYLIDSIVKEALTNFNTKALPKPNVSATGGAAGPATGQPAVPVAPAVGPIVQPQGYGANAIAKIISTKKAEDNLVSSFNRIKKTGSLNKLEAIASYISKSAGEVIPKSLTEPHVETRIAKEDAAFKKLQEEQLARDKETRNLQLKAQGATDIKLPEEALDRGRRFFGIGPKLKVLQPAIPGSVQKRQMQSIDPSWFDRSIFSGKPQPETNVDWRYGALGKPDVRKAIFPEFSSRAAQLSPQNLERLDLISKAVPVLPEDMRSPYLVNQYNFKPFTNEQIEKDWARTANLTGKALPTDAEGRELEGPALEKFYADNLKYDRNAGHLFELASGKVGTPEQQEAARNHFKSIYELSKQIDENDILGREKFLRTGDSQKKLEIARQALDVLSGGVNENNSYLGNYARLAPNVAAMAFPFLRPIMPAIRSATATVPATYRYLAPRLGAAAEQAATGANTLTENFLSRLFGPSASKAQQAVSARQVPSWSEAFNSARTALERGGATNSANLARIAAGIPKPIQTAGAVAGNLSKGIFDYNYRLSPLFNAPVQIAAGLAGASPEQAAQAGELSGGYGPLPMFMRQGYKQIADAIKQVRAKNPYASTGVLKDPGAIVRNEGAAVRDEMQRILESDRASFVGPIPLGTTHPDPASILTRAIQNVANKPFIAEKAIQGPNLIQGATTIAASTIPFFQPVSNYLSGPEVVPPSLEEKQRASAQIADEQSRGFSSNEVVTPESLRTKFPGISNIAPLVSVGVADALVVSPEIAQTETNIQNLSERLSYLQPNTLEANQVKSEIASNQAVLSTHISQQYGSTPERFKSFKDSASRFADANKQYSDFASRSDQSSNMSERDRVTKLYDEANADFRKNGLPFVTDYLNHSYKVDIAPKQQHLLDSAANLAGIRQKMSTAPDTVTAEEKQAIKQAEGYVKDITTWSGVAAATNLFQSGQPIDPQFFTDSQKAVGAVSNLINTPEVKTQVATKVSSEVDKIVGADSPYAKDMTKNIYSNMSTTEKVFMYGGLGLAALGAISLVTGYGGDWLPSLGLAGGLGALGLAGYNYFSSGQSPSDLITPKGFMSFLTGSVEEDNPTERVLNQLRKDNHYGKYSIDQVKHSPLYDKVMTGGATAAEAATLLGTLDPQNRGTLLTALNNKYPTASTAMAKFDSRVAEDNKMINNLGNAPVLAKAKTFDEFNDLAGLGFKDKSGKYTFENKTPEMIERIVSVMPQTVKADLVQKIRSSIVDTYNARVDEEAKNYWYVPFASSMHKANSVKDAVEKIRAAAASPKADSTTKSIAKGLELLNITH